MSSPEISGRSRKGKHKNKVITRDLNCKTEYNKS